MSTQEQLRENIIDLLIDLWHTKEDSITFNQLVEPFKGKTDKQIYKELYKQSKQK